MRHASRPPGIVRRTWFFVTVLAVLAVSPAASKAADGIQYWASEFPKTDFSKSAVKFSDIRSDGAGRDQIPAIDKPKFLPANEVTGLGPLEPVLRIEHFGDVKAYPLRILLWHEIVNDRIGDTPIVASYSPLSNSATIYDRRVEIGGQTRTLSFGNTGRLRHFGAIMYDHQSETWWQQFAGHGIVGRLTGAKLIALPARIEAFGRLRQADPDAEVLVPANPKARPYGRTPFVGMDTSAGEGLEAYALSDEVKPYDRVVVVNHVAWTLKLLKENGTIERENLAITWVPGQNSVHDAKWISFGRDIGNVIVRRFNKETEEWEDAVHTISFAYAFQALVEGGTVYSYMPAN